MKYLDYVICPKCHELVEQRGNSICCKNGHNYDIAKEGYVNLLLVNKKKTKDPGDDLLMVKARNKFLSKHYYDFLVMELTNIIQTKNNAVILDAGCGTGYYLQKISNNLNNSALIGVDISKHAISLASKEDKKSTYIVSSLFDIPIKNNSCDIIFNIFAPKAEKEFSRILKQDGLILEVVPGKDHLKELKNILFQDEYKEIEEKFAFSKLELIDSKRVLYKKKVETNEDVINLLKMTPYWYKGGETKISNLAKVENLEITFDFLVNLWRKKDNIKV